MDKTFDGLTETLDSLYGLPGVVLTFLFCIGLGYFLKMLDVFPNKRIPIIVVLWGMIWNVLLRPPPAPGAIVWQHYCRLTAVGFLIGLVACIAYDKVLKRLEEKYPWLGGLLGGNGKEPDKPKDQKP